jgi:aryl-alcohol dehydrogenase-like predicted oxidoreductase
MEIILGTAQLNRPYGVLDSFREVSATPRPLELLAFAEHSEISGFDTAPVYGDSEILLGLSGVAKPIYTKLDPNISVDESIERSKTRLSLESLQCLYLHEELVAGSRQEKIFSELSGHLGGDVKEVGVSIYSLREYEFALEIPEVTLIQVPYGVLDRRFSEGTLERAAEKGKRVLARSVLLQGLLTVSDDAELKNFPALAPFVSGFREVARAHNISPLTAAMSFAAENRGLSGMIIGARNVEALRAILQAAKYQISGSLISDLGSLALPASGMTDPRKWG